MKEGAVPLRLCANRYAVAYTLRLQVARGGGQEMPPYSNFN